MKDRVLRNKLTTLIGLLVALFPIVAIWYDKMTVWQAIPVWLLSWAFISAKNSLLEGLTAGLLKFK